MESPETYPEIACRFFQLPFTPFEALEPKEDGSDLGVSNAPDQALF